MKREVDVEEDDHYGVLEIDPSASEEVIRAAHTVLISKDDGLKKARNKALEVLLDPSKRETYDQKLVDCFYGRNKIGGYELLSLISENSFSRTYNAKHLETGKLVWITHTKKLSPRNTRILREEVTKGWDIRTFGAAAVRDFFKLPDGQYVIVSSSMPGMSLAAYVAKNGVLAPKHVGWIIDRCLNTLGYFYDYGQVHAAINPRNIILQPGHRAFLIGSNFAGVLPEMIGASAEYEQIFMPPEQIAGERLLPESDFFSLGASAIFGLTGDLTMVKSLKIPDSVPGPMKEFIRLVTKKDSQYRPRWEDGDEEDNNIIKEFREARMKSFGAYGSDREPLPGLAEDKPE
jgi:serine/threonine protein kinase